MKWNEMSTMQKVLFGISCVCAAAWVALAVLPYFGVAVDTGGLRNALFGVTLLCWAVTEPKRKREILWYLLAAAEFALSLWHFLMP